MRSLTRSDRMLEPGDPLTDVTRRHFFGRSGLSLGAAALATLLGEEARGGSPEGPEVRGLSGLPHFAPKARRVIYLVQSGGPSHLDLFDPKPGLGARFGEELPESIRRGQRLTGMTANQATHPVAPSRFAFRRHGQGGAWLSSLLPHT